MRTAFLGLLFMTIGSAAATPSRQRQHPTIRTSGSRTCPPARDGLGQQPQREDPGGARGGPALPAILRRGAGDRAGQGPHSRTAASAAARSTISGRTPTTCAASGGATTLRQLRNRQARSGRRSSTSTRSPRRRRRTGCSRARAAPRPAERRCLVSLSDGGEDAVTVREFDLPTAPVRRGRLRPAQGQAGRRPGSTRTRCSSPANGRKGELGRIRLSLHRQAPEARPAAVSAAVEVFRGKPDDGGYGVSPTCCATRQSRTLPVIDRGRSIPSAPKPICSRRRGRGRLRIPAKTQPRRHGRRPGDRHAGARTGPGGQPGQHSAAGSLVSLDLAAAEGRPGAPQPTLIYGPGPRESIEGVGSTKNVLLVVDARQRARPHLAVHAGRERQLDRTRRWTCPTTSTLLRGAAERHDDQAMIVTSPTS